jgi:hypothetical protein
MTTTTTSPSTTSTEHPIFTHLPQLLQDSSNVYALGRILMNNNLAPHEILAALHQQQSNEIPDTLLLKKIQLARAACDTLIDTPMPTVTEHDIPSWFANTLVPPIQINSSSKPLPPSESRLMDTAQSVIHLFNQLIQSLQQQQQQSNNNNISLSCIEFCSALTSLCNYLPSSKPLLTLCSQSLILCIWDPLMIRVQNDDEARKTMEIIILSLENDFHLSRQDLIQGLVLSSSSDDDDDENSNNSEKETSDEDEAWSDTSDSTASYSVDESTPPRNNQQIPDHCRASIAWALMTRPCQNIFDDVIILSDVGNLSWCHRHSKRLMDEGNVVVIMRGIQLLKCLFPVNLTSRSLDEELIDDVANTLMSALRCATNLRSLAIRDEVDRALMLITPTSISLQIITWLLEWIGGSGNNNSSDAIRGYLLDLCRKQMSRNVKETNIISSCAQLAIKQLEQNPTSFSEANESAISILRFIALLPSSSSSFSSTGDNKSTHTTTELRDWWKSKAISLVRELWRKAKEVENDIDEDEEFRLRVPMSQQQQQQQQQQQPLEDNGQLGNTEKGRARLIANVAELLLTSWGERMSS